jgi:hypothetical protein
VQPLSALLGDDMIRSPRWRQVVHALRKARLKVRLLQSRNSQNEVFMIVGATFERLEEVAEASELQLRFRPMATFDSADGFLNARSLTESSFGVYKAGCASRFAKHHLNRGSCPFSSLTRCRLLEMAVSESLERGLTHSLTLQQLASLKNPLQDVFWLHDELERRVLSRDFDFDPDARRMGWGNPASLLRELDPLALERLRTYFGESVSFYFAWLNFYSRSLVAPALVGLGCYIVFWINRAAYLTLVIPGYAIVTMIWSTSFVETWKAREALLRRQWNADALVENEEARRGFRGTLGRGFYLPDGLWVPMAAEDVEPLRLAGVPALLPEGKRASAHARRARVLVGAVALLATGFTCIVTTLAILLVRSALEGSSYGPYATGGLNALAISTFNSLFRALALKLNEWENHRRSSEFLQALVYKMSLLQFVNCYFSLFYIAFIKPAGVRFLFLQPRQCLDSSGQPPASPDDPARYANCYDELQIQLLMIFASNLVIGTAQELMQASQARMRDRVLERLSDLRSEFDTWREGSSAGLAAFFRRDRSAPPARKRRSSFQRWAARGDIEPPPGELGENARTVLQRAEDAHAQGLKGEAATLEHRALSLELDEQDDLAYVQSEEHGLGATFYEYNELVIQFGYLTMVRRARSLPCSNMRSSCAHLLAPLRPRTSPLVIFRQSCSSRSRSRPLPFSRW